MQHRPQDLDLVGPREAAAILGVHRTTLDRWEADGTIRSARLGGKRYFSRSALIAAMTPPAADNSERAAV